LPLCWNYSCCFYYHLIFTLCIYLLYLFILFLMLVCLFYGVLTPLSTNVQFFRGGQFYWVRKPEMTSHCHGLHDILVYPLMSLRFVLFVQSLVFCSVFCGPLFVLLSFCFVCYSKTNPNLLNMFI
jgi:hypothetical protein